MPSTIRSSFRVKNVENFIHALHENENMLYIGIGRPQFWDVAASSDGVIPTPYNNLLSENADWSDLMSLKRINNTSMAHCVVRRKWQANEKYDAYRHDWSGTRESVVAGIYPTDITESKFYCITDNGTAFICIKQGVATDGSVVPSTQSPQDGSSTIITGITLAASSGLVQCSDGYIWKKIATLTTSYATAFLTAEYYPVTTIKINPGASDAAAADQWLNQTNSQSHGGGIYNINIISTTTNWTVAGNYHITDAKNGSTTGAPSTKILSVIGDGTGLKFLAVIGDNKLKNIIVTDPGQGYTYAKFVMGTAGYSAGGNGTVLEAIFTPTRGLGVDPIRDLVAHNLVINSTFDSDENDKAVDLNHREFTVTNEYRKVVLLANPKLLNGTLATASKLDMTHYMTYTGTTPNPDDIITQNTPEVKGRVLDAGATTMRVLRIYAPESSNEEAGSPESDFAVGSYSTAGGSQTVDTIIEPEVEYGSGDIIYVDYRRPILRDINQLEDIKIVVEY